MKWNQSVNITDIAKGKCYQQKLVSRLKKERFPCRR
jgi:hypothetical protein